MVIYGIVIIRKDVMPVSLDQNCLHLSFKCMLKIQKNEFVEKVWTANCAFFMF